MSNRRPEPIRDRIIAALEQSGGKCEYHKLLRLVFPPHQFPHAFERPNRGGPPGCSMALSRAISRYGFHMTWPKDRLAGVVHTTISMGNAQPADLADKVKEGK